MSTRGLMGIKKKGELKAQYNHFDSYISGLGKSIIETINEIPKNDRIEVLNKTFDNIFLVEDNEENYRDLREYQGNLKAYILGFNYMIDNRDFINDTLFCEYAYVINLDTNKLEITYGWHNRITKEFDLLDLDYKKIEKECEEVEDE